MKQFLWVLLMFLGSQVQANELKVFDFEVADESTESKLTKAECKFDGISVPENVVIYAAGGYSGRSTDFQIDQSGHSAKQFDVAINSKTRPVILILGSYEPTIWNLGWSSGTEITAVLVSGYHKQVVAGLVSDVPILISTQDNSGPCGYFYIHKDKNKSLNPKSRKLFGKPVDLVFLADKHGKIVVGDALSKSEKLVTSKNNTPESYRDTNAPLAGQAGLDEAVSNGIIRKATLADANQWLEAVAVNNPKQDVPPIAGQSMTESRKPGLHNAYVILEEFTFPAGLYGADAATFFIAKNVTKPKGNPGHSSVYDFNTLICSGAVCLR